MRRIKLLFPFPFKTRRNQIPFRSKNVTMLPCFHPPFSTPPLSVSVNQKLIEDYIFLTVRHLGGWFKCFTREKSEYMKLIVAKNDLSSLIPMQGHGLSSLKSMQQHAGLFEFETNENSWSFEFETNGNSWSFEFETNENSWSFGFETNENSWSFEFEINENSCMVLRV